MSLPSHAAIFSLDLHSLSIPQALLRVTGTLAGHAATFLIDCGASNDFVSTSFTKRHCLALAPTDRTVRGYDGTAVLSAGVLNAPLCIESDKGYLPDVTQLRSFTAAPLHGEDAILGLPWLNSVNPLVDWTQAAFRSSKGGITHTLKSALPRRLHLSSPPTGTGSNCHHLITHICKLYDQHSDHSGSEEDAPDPAIKDLLYAAIASTSDPTLSCSTPSDENVPLPHASTAVSSNGPVAQLSTAAVSNGPANPPLSQHEKELTQLREDMFCKYAKVFPDDLPAGLPPSRGLEHRIELKPNSIPPARAGLRYSRADEQGIADFVEENLKKGFIKPSQSSYAAIPFQVAKKGTEERRTVVDYRALNEQTVKSKYPLPLMEELFDRLQGAKYFTKLDLRTGFHQIRIRAEDTHKTAFRTSRGLFEYLVLAMGLCNAPGTFMQLMNETFADFHNKFVLVFLDDIIIFSNSLEEHKAHLESVLSRLQDRQLYAKRSKCSLFQQEVEFLGHYVGVNGLRVMEDKLAAVTAWPTPSCVRDVRAFLGLVGFYRRFIKDFSRIALSLTALTRTVTGAPFSWGAIQQAAFDKLKLGLQRAPVLVLPDPKLPWVVHTDASGFAIGAVLQQDQGKGLQPIAFLSKKMSDAETRYPVHEQELLAIVTAMHTWQHHLKNASVRVLTDHKSLVFFQTQPMLSGRQVRWMDTLSQFQFTIEYIKGPTNIVADALSRRSDLCSDSTPLDRPLRVVDPQANVICTQSNINLLQCRVFTQTANMLTAELNAIEANEQHSSRQAELQRKQARARAVEAATKIGPPAPDRPRPNASGTIVMPTQRCTADNKRGTQCKSLTTKGQHCWNHLRSITGLRIKASTIPLAGMGLYAERDFPAGTHIADYTGDILTLRQASDGGPYCLQLNSRTCIDASRTNSASGRWANDPRGSDRGPNSSFVLNTRNRTGRLQASRMIRKGEEILVSYGQGYWSGYPSIKAGHCRKNKVKLPVDPEDLLLNQLLVSSFDSDLTRRITEAGHSDPTYIAALKAKLPPDGHLKVIEGHLYYDDRIYIGSDALLRTELMRECHDAALGGHLGKDKTTEQLKRRFYWPGMDEEIRQYVTSCDSCQRNKPSQQAMAGMLMPLPIPPRPWHTVSLDLITALARSRRGNDAIVVFVCKLTRMVHYVACSTTVTAPQLAQLFMDTVVLRHGLPECILSDRDPRFTATFWRAFWAKLGTTLLMSTSNHPQTDGQTENSNKTLETILRSQVSFEQDDWDDHLTAAELAVNNSVNATTGFTPFYLNSGQEARMPLDSAISPLRSVISNATAEQTLSRWQAALKQAVINVQAAQQRQAGYADQHRRDVTFKVSDKVLLSSKHLQLLGDAKRSRKLTARFIGPYPITRVINDNAYELELPPSLRIHPVVNISALKPYHDGNAAFPHRQQPATRPPPESYDSSGNAIHLVERVLDKRTSGRGVQYLVLWTGFPPEEATWEPASNLTRSPDAIAAYEASASSHPRPRRSTRRG